MWERMHSFACGALWPPKSNYVFLAPGLSVVLAND